MQPSRLKHRFDPRLGSMGDHDVPASSEELRRMEEGVSSPTVSETLTSSSEASSTLPKPVRSKVSFFRCCYLTITSYTATGCSFQLLPALSIMKVLGCRFYWGGGLVRRQVAEACLATNCHLLPGGLALRWDNQLYRVSWLSFLAVRWCSIWLKIKIK